MKVILTYFLLGMVILAEVQSVQIRLLGGTNCATVDSSGNCTSCYYRYVVKNGSCVAVSDLCQTWDSNGLCTSCYYGYALTNGVCSYTTTNTPSSDPNCVSFGADGSCVACSYRYVLINNKCVQVSDQCKTWDITTALCTTCSEGYIFVNGFCDQPLADPSSPDPNCADTDSSGNCIACSPRYYFHNGICTKISDLCNTWNTTTGACTSCYQGYTLSNGACK